MKNIERTEKTKGFDANENVDEINSVYIKLYSKLTSRPFDSYAPLKGQGQKLSEFSDRFFELNVSEKCRQLFNIAKLLNGAGETVDLSPIYSEKGGVLTGTQSGGIGITINGKNKSTLSLINTSISGFYTNKRKVF